MMVIKVVSAWHSMASFRFNFVRWYVEIPIKEIRCTMDYKETIKDYMNEEEDKELRVFEEYFEERYLGLIKFRRRACLIGNTIVFSGQSRKENFVKIRKLFLWDREGTYDIKSEIAKQIVNETWPAMPENSIV